MKQTAISGIVNAELLAMIPRAATRVVEVGCSGGALARQYRLANPRCEYVGIETDPDYAEAARPHCSRMLVGNIEHLPEAEFATLLPADCWVFGDVLEHLYDPWAVLRRIRGASATNTTVVACIPNLQHWTMQVRINVGDFRYEDSGLFDRTHIRWFTRRTIAELFDSTGFTIVEAGGRVFDEPQRERGLRAVRALATVIGADPDTAASDATPLQWVVRAVPKADSH